MSEIAARVAGSSSRYSALALLLLLETGLIVTWSAGFIGVRFASDHAPIFLILLWRSLVSGLLLLPVALFVGPPLRWRDVRPQILFGALAMSGYLAGFALAIALGVPTGLTALITDMLPLAVAVLSWPILGRALTGGQWIGSLIGFAGVIIASAHSLSLGNVAPWAYALPVLGTLSLAFATLLLKRSPSIGMPVHQSLCIQCLSAAVIFSLFAWNEGGVLPVMNAGFIGGVLWLAVVATLGSWSLYYLALRRSSPARVTSVVYLSPPVTMIWAWVAFGEPLSVSMAVGLVVSLVGVIIVARGQPKEAAAQAHA
ncbi:MAG: DMT family transporter [Allorhizobium sp.]